VVNRRSGVAATTDAVFQIQSITKVWTATLVMQLADEGRIDLDDSIGTHLPGFRTADPRASARVTVRHLLTHRGGFEGDVWTATTAGEDALQRLVEDVIPAVPQHEPPGSRYSYCSAGMAVLGRLVEVLRGRPFATVLRERLADPLGIKEIACNADEALGFNTAIGHVSYGDRGVRPLPMWAALPESNPAAGNQLSMSARALLAFGRMHLDDGVGPDGERVLSAASAKAMRVGGVAIPASPAAPKEVGLGWEVHHGGAVIGHAGGAPGFSSYLLLLPGSRTAIALLTNGGDFKGLMRDLIDPWITEAANVTLMPEQRPPETAPQVAGSDRFVGVYGVRTCGSRSGPPMAAAWNWSSPPRARPPR
jgi:CubicO group peptidase (beta-lactamase class C family)